MQFAGKLLCGDECDWQITREIGQGRYGVVCLALDKRGRVAALKCLKPQYAQREALVRGILRELTVLRTLRHKAFPKLIDQGLAGGLPFLVTEFLDGETADARRRGAGGRLGEEDVLNIARETLEGLIYAHEAGIIHGDVSPNNIFVTNTGESRLLDLGLCRAIESAGMLDCLTGPHLVGTPGFIAPEQSAIAWNSADARVDVWSLGATLFWLLTGERARAASPNAPTDPASCGPAWPPSDVLPNISTDIVAWLNRALADDPAKRWRSTAEMRRALPELRRTCSAKSKSGTGFPLGSVSVACPATAEQSNPISCERPSDLALHLVHNPHYADLRRISLKVGSGLTLGRDGLAADICINDRHISRLHARLDWDDEADTYRLVDLGSLNGTDVNGSRCNVAQLRAGDVLRMGQSLLVLTDETQCREFERVVAAACQNAAPALLIGETGVGKDRLARRIHHGSNRSGEFIAINCGSLTHELAASELFGHERGAFTGASNSRPGLFRAAHRGTLLLDEIGDLQRSLQVILLRALQESSVRPLGAAKEQSVDVRIIAATNVPLNTAISNGQFRLDLYARLNALSIQVPPLRERRHEVLKILSDLAAEMGHRLEVDSNAAEAILLGPWPTNVRGLQRLLTPFSGTSASVWKLTLSALRCQESELVDNWQRRKSRDSCLSVKAPFPVDALRHRHALEQCLHANGGNVSRVAKQLKTTRAQVYRWMKRLGIDKRTFARSRNHSASS